MLSNTLLSSEVAQLLMLPVPCTEQPEMDGYVAITLSSAGNISVRGSQAMLTWLLARLAAKGWYIQLDQIRWCG